MKYVLRYDRENNGSNRLLMAAVHVSCACLFNYLQVARDIRGKECKDLFGTLDPLLISLNKAFHSSKELYILFFPKKTVMIFQSTD